jgi:hypothetical protein
MLAALLFERIDEIVEDTRLELLFFIEKSRLQKRFQDSVR